MPVRDSVQHVVALLLDPEEAVRLEAETLLIRLAARGRQSDDVRRSLENA